MELTLSCGQKECIILAELACCGGVSKTLAVMSSPFLYVEACSVVDMIKHTY